MPRTAFCGFLAVNFCLLCFSLIFHDCSLGGLIFICYGKKESLPQHFHSRRGENQYRRNRDKIFCTVILYVYFVIGIFFYCLDFAFCITGKQVQLSKSKKFVKIEKSIKRRRSVYSSEKFYRNKCYGICMYTPVAVVFLQNCSLFILQYFIAYLFRRNRDFILKMIM